MRQHHFKKFSLLKNSETQTTDRTIMDNSEPKEEQIKDLPYWKANAEEDYMKVPISVLRYISEIESRYTKLEEERERVAIAIKQINRLLAEQPQASWEVGFNVGVRSSLDVLQSLFPPSEKGDGRKENCDHNFPPISGWNAHQPQRCSNCGEDF